MLLCCSEIDRACFPLTRGQTTGVKTLPRAGLCHLEEGEWAGKRMRPSGNWRPMSSGRHRGHLPCPFRMDKFGATRPMPHSLWEGLDEERKGKKKGYSWKEWAKLPFCSSVQTVDFMLRSAPNIKGCFTARRSPSQPQDREQDEHQVGLAEASFNPYVWQRGDKTSDTSLWCRLNLRIYKRSSFMFWTVSHASLAICC